VFQNIFLCERLNFIGFSTLYTFYIALNSICICYETERLLSCTGECPYTSTLIVVAVLVCFSAL